MTKAKRLPYLQLYTADWRADPGLRMCSLAARGLWADLLTLMHEAEPRGELRIGTVLPTAGQLAALIGSPEAEVAAALAELEANGVFSRRKNGAIYCRRMVRDEERRRKNRENGAKGGNPNLRKTTEKSQSVNRPANPQSPETRVQSLESPPVSPPKGGEDAPDLFEAQAGSDPSPEPRPNPSRGSRLPDDWQLPQPWGRWAVQQGLPERDVRRQALLFKNHWLAAAGAKGRKADWKATWQNWILREIGNRESRSPPRPTASSSKPRMMEMLRKQYGS